MIINNIVSFIYHILLIILSTIYLMIVVALGPHIEGILTSTLVRGILVLFWVLIYVFIGTRLKRSQKRNMDFFSGTIILIFGLSLFFYSIYDGEFLTFFKVYLNPVYQIFLTLGIDFSLPLRLFSCFVPSLLIGLGVRIKRITNTRRYSRAY